MPILNYTTSIAVDKTVGQIQAMLAEAEEIGYDSWWLNNFSQLPLRASKARQITALKNDHEWQENHMNEISRRIDQLIQRIESE